MIVRKYITIALLAACIWSLGVAAEPEMLPEPEPPVQPSAKGSVQAVLRPAGMVKQVRLLHRPTGEVHAPAHWDKESGKVRFDSLPGGRNYDLQILTTDARTIEGIDLSFTDQRLLRLARRGRKLRDLPPWPPHAFLAADAKEIAEFVRRQEDFMDWSRTLYVQGHGRYATALVERMRTRAFYDGNGELIWRVELWYFQWEAGSWTRLANQEKVLRRERTTPRKWAQIDVSYLPALSVYVDEEGKSETVKLSLPEKTDPRRGRPARSEPKLPAQPFIDGLDVPREEPSPDASSAIQES
jgi:hypothetical protein